MTVDLTMDSTLMDAHEFMEDNKSNQWSNSTKRSYRKTVADVESFMEELNIAPTINNVDFNLVKKWENSLYEVYAEKTIKQKIAAMTSLFKYLRDVGINTLNPFATLTTSNNDTYGAHSRVLDIEELYAVYKAAHELESQGTPVLIPTLTVMFTGFRNVTLTKLKVSTVDFKKSQLAFKLKQQDSNKAKHNNQINNKIKELIVPLPPKLMEMLAEHTANLNKHDHLLYGLRGKPLANKQMNYVTKLICQKLNWVDANDSDTAESDDATLAFTPHGFRYTIATLFSEMNVDDQSIRHVLGHSHFERGNLRIYIKTYNKNIKQIRIAQLLLEILFATTLEIETKYNLKIDLKQVFESIDIHYSNAMLNIKYLDYFKSMLINLAVQIINEQMLQTGEGHRMMVGGQQPFNPHLASSPQHSVPLQQLLYQNAYVSSLNNPYVGIPQYNVNPWGSPTAPNIGQPINPMWTPPNIQLPF